MHIICIRIALGLALLYGVYTETGIWTTLFLFLAFVSTELEAYLKQKNNNMGKGMRQNVEHADRKRLS